MIHATSLAPMRRAVQLPTRSSAPPVFFFWRAMGAIAETPAAGPTALQTTKIRRAVGIQAVSLDIGY
jgi:hypothetical protein